MSIRFRCGQCSQPIEVDDPLAGKLARCPYCTAVITVPAESTLIDEPIATARPASNLPPLPAAGGSFPAQFPPTPDPRLTPPGYPVPSATDSEARALLPARGARMGNFALICTLLVVGLLGGGMVWSAVKVFPRYEAALKERKTPPTFSEMMEITDAVVKNDPVYSALAIGASFFAICGFAFAASSFRATGAENWRAWVATVVCVPLVVCNCLGVLAAFAR